MIAVPMVLAGTARGVLTAVRITRTEPFDPGETLAVARYAEILANLLIQNLTSRILE